MFVTAVCVISYNAKKAKKIFTIPSTFLEQKDFLCNTAQKEIP